MNEFIEQFLVECRELVEQSTDDLLALEEQPADRERLDSAFRAFHTLKGAAGIVEFDAMGRALHAAEDLLARVRSAESPVTSDLVGDCLTCLDQVVQWLDEMAVTGENPPNAEPAADVVVRRFAREPATAGPVPSAAADWLPTLVARHPHLPAQSAVRYAPPADAFFHEVDPLALFADTPGLLALDAEPAGPWPELAALDPFECRLVIYALSSVPAGALVDLLPPEAEVRSLALDTAAQDLPERAHELLAAQVELLQTPVSEGLPGRIGAAARVAAAILRRLNRLDDALRLEQLGAASVSARDAASLSGALSAILAGRPAPGASQPEPSTAPAAAAEPDAAIVADAAQRTLRVDIERVDALVNLTGELTIAKNALGHALALAREGADAATLADVLRRQQIQLDRLVADLQHAVLNIRVLPLRTVFQRFPRLIREMVVQLGKPARLVTEGDVVEADKAVVETLFEPLLHVLRNALDHGIEPPEQRASLGKPPSATIDLRARRDGDRVVVEVEDDGRGIDIARVRELAVVRGLVAADDAAALTEAEVADLIFAPGFSTAAQVTNLSGRGVGMDAVRTVVERMGGRVSVASRPGQGTTVRFTLPFTVMMTQVMTVEAAGQTFGIPLEAVVETVRLPRGRIQPIGAAQAFVLRDRTLPLIDLAQALGKPGDAMQRDEVNVVVASAGGHVGGLEVDRLGERMEVMLKPMDGLLSGTPGIAGTTLLGDGRVLLVLDLQELLA
jgi:two-component system chemotaxis sensor kinase CheA